MVDETNLTEQSTMEMDGEQSNNNANATNKSHWSSKATRDVRDAFIVQGEAQLNYNLSMEEPSAPILGKPKLNRNRTVPAAAKFFSSSSKKVTSEDNFRANAQLKEGKKASKIHPIFNSLYCSIQKSSPVAKPAIDAGIQATLAYFP
ncbi:hypothetical protein RND71_014886 [Anisodus tanguticus]|uniref:Uncharacterized protein n=1 Tax=Anisodus tanguticus TaxID=243964 RepID=A0AAE1SC45_9SOLA|nr:hypothetical protein RND71_014886 [Anisodus tanguticus]